MTPGTSAERLAEVLFDAEHGNGAWHDHTGDAVDLYYERAQYAIERLAELAESDRIERGTRTSQAGPSVEDLANRHCETFTSNATCADDPDRSADSPYGATGFCYPCLVRNALLIDPSTIRDVTPPPATPEEGDR